MSLTGVLQPADELSSGLRAYNLHKLTCAVTHS